MTSKRAPNQAQILKVKMISTKGKISHSNYPLKCLDLLDKVHDKSASAKRNAVILYSYPSIKLKKKGQLSLGADVDCLICQVFDSNRSFSRIMIRFI